VVLANPKHTFQFLTKNPKRYVEFELPQNAWYGTTDDGTGRTRNNIYELTDISHRTIFVSFEPLLTWVDFFDPLVDWIIIGANSNRGAKKPPIAWADSLIIHAQLFDIPIWVKDNYNYPQKIKEFPV
jgi:protein gp37